MRTSWKRLAIDTATKYVYLSLVVDDKEVDSVFEEGMNNHSVTVIPHLVAMLNRQQISLRDIDEIICGIGPGSYTGIRIAVTIAKMIGHLNLVQIKTVSSLALIASTALSGLTLALIDARRGNGFMGLFDNKDGIMIRLEPDILDDIERYKAYIQKPFAIVSEGKPNIEKIINSDLMEVVSDPMIMVPNYLQVTEAEKARGRK